MESLSVNGESSVGSLAGPSSKIHPGTRGRLLPMASNRGPLSGRKPLSGTIHPTTPSAISRPDLSGRVLRPDGFGS
jgi:hypothetical protein